MNQHARPDKVFLNNWCYSGPFSGEPPVVDMSDIPKDDQWLDMAYQRAAFLLIRSGEFKRNGWEAINDPIDGMPVEDKFSISLNAGPCRFGSTFIHARSVRRKWYYEVITT